MELLHLCESQQAAKYMLSSFTDILCWDRVRKFILKEHHPVIGSKYQYPALKYPEFVLQLFGELYLDKLKASSHQLVPLNSKVQTLKDYEWVLYDFRNWGVEVNPILKLSFVDWS